MTGNHPYKELGPAEPGSPVLISVPHAGRDYPAGFALLSRLSIDRIRPLEDRYADLLIEKAVERGHRAIVSKIPRVWIDLNRGEREYDPDLIAAGGSHSQPLPSAKVRGGLGVVPRRVIGGGDIWRGSLSAAEFEARLADIHRPWHSRIADILGDMAGGFGGAILVDLHSMPPLPIQPGITTRPQIVIGDLFGRSAGGRVAQAALGFVQDQGIAATLNSPYAGGHTLERHGRPDRNVHALQVEIDRSLYLDLLLDRPGAGLSRMQGFIAGLATFLAAEICASPFAEAAE